MRLAIGQMQKHQDLLNGAGPASSSVTIVQTGPFLDGVQRRMLREVTAQAEPHDFWADLCSLKQRTKMDDLRAGTSNRGGQKVFKMDGTYLYSNLQNL